MASWTASEDRPQVSFAKTQYDVVLLYPPAEEILEIYDVPEFPNIGIAYVGAYLEAHGGVTPACIDARMSRLSLDETVERVVALRPRVLGIGAMTPMVLTAAEIAARVKQRLPGVRTVLGGFHASFLPERSLEEFAAFDHVAVGESEMAFCELVGRVLSGLACDDVPGIWSRSALGCIRNGRGAIPPTLDELGEPGWHLFDPDDMARYCTTLPVMGVRGCPFACNFCSRPYGRKVRKRTPARIVDEIARGVEAFGVHRVHFFDETFSVDGRHTEELCRDIVARGLEVEWTCTVHANTVDLELARLMRSAGCTYVGFGIESGDPAILKSMGKGVDRARIERARGLLKQAGITTMGFFIFGHPNETRRSIWRTIRFAVRLNTDVAAIGILVPYPGTDTWELAIRGEGGYRKLSPDWRDYNKQLGNAVELAAVPRREIELYQILAYVLIYLCNGRFRDFFALARQHAALASSILIKILLPRRVQRGAAAIFRNDGGRIRLRRKRPAGTWG
jgi:anaerobic magnesium-protoporphyrin IX monomethyl ester cyclase